MGRSFFQHKPWNQSLPQEVIIRKVVRNDPNILFYVIPQKADHKNFFLQDVLINKYIGFDIDSKKIAACVIESVVAAKFSALSEGALCAIIG